MPPRLAPQPTLSMPLGRDDNSDEDCFREQPAVNTFVVVNPAAGGGRAKRVWPRARQYLKDHLGTFDFAETQSPGHATSLVAKAIENGATRIIALGGDGTANEAVNGMVSETGIISPRLAFGTLPTGTGSDFSRSIWKESQLARQCDRIGQGATRKTDLGRIRFETDQGIVCERMFVNISSLGVSGLVDRAVNGTANRKFVPRKAVFLFATVRALAAYRFQRVRMTVDHAAPIEMTIALVAIANGRFFGGGMMIAPDAMLEDGRFDIVTVVGNSKMTLLLNLGRVFTGTHRSHHAITIQRCRAVTVEPCEETDAIFLDIDGESLGRLPATFEIVPSALNVIA